MSSEICNKCILHSRVPQVEIDETGLCKSCLESEYDQKFNKKAAQYARKRFMQLLEETKKQHNTYDALVLFSGGKDSSYLLKTIKEKYKLRVLAFSVIHPLVSETVSKNMDNVTRNLGVELIKYQVREDVFKKAIRQSLLHPEKYGLGEFFGCDICSFQFYWTAIQFALKLNIKLIFTGDDSVQTNGAPRFISGESVKQRIKQGIKPFGSIHDVFEDALGKEYKQSIFNFDQEKLLTMDYPDLIGPFTFMEHDYGKGTKSIESMGLDSKKFNKLVTNCDAIPFYAYFTLKKYNCVPYIKHFASEIRNQKPYLTQYLINTDQEQILLDRADFLSLMDEYKHIVEMVVEHGFDLNNTNEQQRKKILEKAGTFKTVLGEEISAGLLEKVLQIKQYAEYFNVDIHSI